MTEGRRVSLQRWDGGRSDERDLSRLSRSEVEQTICAMASEWSAVLTIGIGARSLLVGAGGGIYTVTALLGPDDFYDLVGDAGAEGSVFVVQGGQGVEVPRAQLHPL